ncbi:hypothetical protein [Xanthobacter autotrophicus]|uniref:hypothetical protein n=1 Tax=Xanthobacter autotrophicus TaxID=280 RepID=UPI0024A76C8C|nr:hypothetical protein [Xanthobacter autotrophicus]MDI4655552.1 hypothetical protein [Xanthobacter autotrophicus]
MDLKPVFDLNRLPKGEWLFLAEAMQFALWGAPNGDEQAHALPGSLLEGLAADDADKFNARIFQLQGDMQRAARDGTLVMKGIPMMFWIGSVAEDPAARQPIPAEFFMVDGVRGFDYEDGAIAPFSFEGDEQEEYNRLLRRCTVPAAGSADQWAHVIVRRDDFITFLRDHLGADLSGETDRMLDLSAPTVSGRPRKYDWEGAMAHLTAKANTPDGIGDWSQGKIARAMVDWLAVQNPKNIPNDDQAKLYARRVYQAIHPDRKRG